MYEAYLVTETDEDDGDETAAQDWRWLVLEMMKTINAGSFFSSGFSLSFFCVSSQSLFFLHPSMCFPCFFFSVRLVCVCLFLQFPRVLLLIPPFYFFFLQFFTPRFFFSPPLCFLFFFLQLLLCSPFSAFCFFPPVFPPLLFGPSSGFYSQRMHALWQEHGNGRRAL